MEGAGISFIVRIRNEEATLARSIRSLVFVTVPHEIILILHRCTDKSAEIAASLVKENPHVRVLTYDHQVSRAGYETLATDKDSDHSFIRYSNWCAEQARYPWIFRWDADFVMKPMLLGFINQQEWGPQNLCIGITAKNGTHENQEYYLYPSSTRNKKHIFWELGDFPSPSPVLHLQRDFYLIHLSELSDLKPYWKEAAWFLSDDSPEALQVKERYDKLVSEFGPEPVGMARASNPECDRVFARMVSARNCAGPEYVNFFA
jgi:glycosyltransferase involved in cell wall biosynthesis